MPAAPARPPRAGWYADPRGVGATAEPAADGADADLRTAADPDAEQFRWWDGEAWTAWLADSAYAPTPRGAVPRVIPVPGLTPPRSLRWFTVGWAASLLTVLLLATSLIGQGMPQQSQHFLRARPTDLGTPERVYRDYVFGPDRRAVIYERVEMTLPDEVRPLSDVDRINTVLRRATQAYIPIGTGEELVANLLIGDAEPELVATGDARTSAERILPALIARYRQGGGVTPERVRTEPWPTIPGAVRVTGFLRYATPTAGADGDHLLMVVTPWAQGPHSGMAVWIALVPETAPPETTDALLTREPGITLAD
ncbi:hypothetical protein [Granulicoccus sp. GXG6511]|uniref:hypothetical protein n=1 Tax=Granulicoccus sp. GXG6511 TaxID=3381351 RepID=UPI003D7CB107